MSKWEPRKSSGPFIRVNVPKLNKTVRRDARGLYIITNGGVYRPEHGKWHQASMFDYQPQPEFFDGERVYAAHVNQTPTIAIIKGGGHETRWDLHGEASRYDEKLKRLVKLPTEDAWHKG